MKASHHSAAYTTYSACLEAFWKGVDQNRKSPCVKQRSCRAITSTLQFV